MAQSARNFHAASACSASYGCRNGVGTSSRLMGCSKWELTSEACFGRPLLCSLLCNPWPSAAGSFVACMLALQFATTCFTSTSLLGCVVLVTVSTRDRGQQDWAAALPLLLPPKVSCVNLVTISAHKQLCDNAPCACAGADAYSALNTKGPQSLSCARRGRGGLGGREGGVPF